MICVRRKIWSETEQITQPTGRGRCGGSRAKAPMRKTYVGVKRHYRQSTCNWTGLRKSASGQHSSTKACAHPGNNVSGKMGEMFQTV